MDYIKKTLRWKSIIFALMMALVLTIIIIVSIGPVKIPLPDVFNILLNALLNEIYLLLGKMPLINGLIAPPQILVNPTHESIILHIRLPRILLAVLVGAALAAAGTMMQGLFKNPMADPFIIGISSGAAAAVSATIVLGIVIFGRYTIPIMAFLGATTAAFVVYNIARVGEKVPVETLLLSGIAVGAFLSAITSFMIFLAGEDLHHIIFWMMGGFWAANWEQVKLISPLICIGIVIIYFFAKDLNVMLLGEEPAQHLGISVESFKKIMLIFASLITAAAVSFSGLIGFVGLIIPHIVRILTGPDHRILLPASALVGAIFLAWADTLARTIMAPAELPVGIITALFGAPFFVYLLRTRKRTMF